MPEYHLLQCTSKACGCMPAVWATRSSLFKIKCISGRRPVTEMLSHLLQSKAGPARLVAVLVQLRLPSFFAACSGSNSVPSHARANTPQAVQVTVAPALRQDLPIYLTGLGSIEAYYTVSVKSR